MFMNYVIQGLAQQVGTRNMYFWPGTSTPMRWWVSKIVNSAA